MAIETVRWFFDKTPENEVTHIYVSAPYSLELIEEIRGQKGSQGGGIPRCNKRFSDEKYWVLTPLGRPDFTPNALETVQAALQKIKNAYEGKILPTLRKPTTYRFTAHNLGLDSNYTGTCDFYGLQHIFQDGHWQGCRDLPGQPTAVPFSLWVWTPRGEQPGIRLSPSGLSTFDQCPYRWFLNYVIGLKEPGRLRQHIGSAAHQGCEYFHKLLMLETELTWQTYKEAEAVAEAALMDQYQIEKLETPVEPAELATSLHSVQRMLRSYQRFLVANPIRILGAEEAFSVPTGLQATNPGTGEKLPVILTGRADLRYCSDTDGTDVVSDLKTSLKALPTTESKVFSTYDQATIYALLSQYTNKRPVGATEIREVHPYEGVRPTQVPLAGTLDTVQHELQQQVQTVIAAIEKGHFRRRRNFNCDWCPMLEYCFRGANLNITTTEPTNQTV